MDEPHVLEPGRRLLVTAAVMVAVFIQVLDQTIANVALPHMQASLGATNFWIGHSKSSPDRPSIFFP